MTDGIICIIDIDYEKSSTVPSVDNVLIMLLSLIITKHVIWDNCTFYGTFHHCLYILLMTCASQFYWGGGVLSSDDR